MLIAQCVSDFPCQFFTGVKDASTCYKLQSKDLWEGKSYLRVSLYSHPCLFAINFSSHLMKEDANKISDLVPN